jgi:type VI secretion system secreted protein Hcp
MFLKIGDIKGETRDSKKKEEIDILAWSWGMSNSGTAHMGGGAGAGKVNVQDISVTKYVDAASSVLLKACCEGKHYDDATLTVRKAGGTPLEYIIIEMKEVMITAVSTGGSGGEDRLTENVTLNFAEFKFKYQPQDAKGAAAGGVKEYGYKIAENATA